MELAAMVAEAITEAAGRAPEAAALGPADEHGKPAGAGDAAGWASFVLSPDGGVYSFRAEGIATGKLQEILIRTLLKLERDAAIAQYEEAVHTALTGQVESSRS